MKNILLSVLCLFSISAIAQGWFLQPSVGLGYGNIKGMAKLYPHKFGMSASFVTVYDVQMLAGYETKHIVWGTGLGYLRSGYADAGEQVSKTKYLTTYFNHLVVPATIGYKFQGKRLSFIPTVGAELAYNYSGRETDIHIVYNNVIYINADKMVHIDDGYFRNMFKQFCVFGTVRFNFDFIATSRLSITFAPTIDYMLSNILRLPPGMLSPTQRNYNYMLNAGVKLRMVKHKKKAADTK